MAANLRERFLELRQIFVPEDAYDLRRTTIGRGASSEQILAAQQELGVAFPEDYAAFLREVGWAEVGDLWTMYGLGDDVPSVLNLVSMTQSERAEMYPRIPPYLLPFQNDGGGNHYCLDTRSLRNGRCPVVFWCHELDEQQTPRPITTDFTAWLSTELDALRDSSWPDNLP